MQLPRRGWTFGLPVGPSALLIHNGLHCSLSSYRQCLSAKSLFKDDWHRSRESNTYKTPDVIHPYCDVTAWVVYMHAVPVFSNLTWNASCFSSTSWVSFKKYICNRFNFTQIRTLKVFLGGGQWSVWSVATAKRLSVFENWTIYQSCCRAKLFWRDTKYGPDESTLCILQSSYIFHYWTNYRWIWWYKFNLKLSSKFFLWFQSDTNITPTNSFLLCHAGKNKICHYSNQVHSNSIEKNISWGFWYS